MDELNLNALEQIPIPEGLEERLSAKIDKWEQREKKAQHRIRRSRALRYMAAAACVALVVGVGLHLRGLDEKGHLPRSCAGTTASRACAKPVGIQPEQGYGTDGKG